jgi:plasmid stability protein
MPATHHSVRRYVANLSIRKIDEETLRQLRIQAASHGISMEEEVRQIIKRALESSEKLGDLAVRLFGPAYGSEALILPEREVSAPLDFKSSDRSGK